MVNSRPQWVSAAIALWGRLGTLALVLLLPGLAAAHALFPKTADPQEQRQFAQAVEQMQACVARLDQAAIHDVQARANQTASRLRYLCFSGEREEAEQLRRAFYQQVAGQAVVKQVRACSAGIPERFGGFVSSPLDLAQFSGEAGGHICDEEIVPVDQFTNHRH